MRYTVKLFDQVSKSPLKERSTENLQAAKYNLWELAYDVLKNFGKLDTKAAHVALDNIRTIDQHTVSWTIELSNTGYTVSFERGDE